MSGKGISPETRIGLAPKVTLRPLGEGEGGVLLRLDTGEMYTVNDTTVAFLNEADGTNTLADIVARLSEVFDVETDVLRNDLIEVADELMDEHLIEAV